MSHWEEELNELLGVPFVNRCRTLLNKKETIPSMKPKDVHHTIKIPLEKFCTDYCVQLKADKKLPCKNCSGQGRLTSSKICMQCRGSKLIWSNNTTRLCNSCNGTGYQLTSCMVCKGQKGQSVENIFKIKIPKGSYNKTKIRLTGKGDNMLNDPQRTSDIVCTVVEEPHPVFTRVQSDLYVMKIITTKQALCGFNFVLKHVDGRKLFLKVKPGFVTKPGTFKIAKNQGMPKPNSTKRGNLIICFDVSFPDKMSTTVVSRLISAFNDTKYDGTVSIPEDHEEYNLTQFDPKEQVYNVPFRQTSVYNESPAKQQSYNAIPNNCKQQ